MAMRSSLIMRTTIEEGTEMSKMFNPPHPGEILADTVLREDGGISVTAFAEKLGVTRTAISRIIHGKAAISTDMSIRLEEALGTSAETWLAMQAAYDLWQAKKNKRRKKIARITMDVNRSAA
jgi:addiction module HigA family antidote